MKPSVLKDYYEHYSEVPLDKWKWRYFSPKEVASQGDGSILINEETLNKADLLREKVGHALYVNSWYRDPEHNKRVGGGANSEHLNGRAIDISLDNIENRQLFYELAKVAGFTGFGFYDTFMHIDTGKPRFWGDWRTYV